MIEEAERLSRVGVSCYDAYRENTFYLKVHIVLCTGDTPAVAKLLSIKSSTAVSCCRFCKIKGKYSAQSISDVQNSYTLVQDIMSAAPIIAKSLINAPGL